MSETNDVSDVEPSLAPQPRPRTWVLVRRGIVEAVRHTANWFRHPFGDDLGEDGRVIDGTGADVRPGYMVDAKGNFTPAEGRTAPIPEGLPAYHGGPGVVRTPAELAVELSGAGVEQRPPSITGRAVENDAGLATVEPRNKDVAEHDAPTEPVHTTGVVDPHAKDPSAENRPAGEVAHED